MTWESVMSSLRAAPRCAATSCTRIDRSVKKRATPTVIMMIRVSFVRIEREPLSMALRSPRGARVFEDLPQGQDLRADPQAVAIRGLQVHLEPDHRLHEGEFQHPAHFGEALRLTHRQNAPAPGSREHLAQPAGLRHADEQDVAYTLRGGSSDAGHQDGPSVDPFPRRNTLQGLAERVVTENADDHRSARGGKHPWWPLHVLGKGVDEAGLDVGLDRWPIFSGWTLLVRRGLLSRRGRLGGLH